MSAALARLLHSLNDRDEDHADEDAADGPIEDTLDLRIIAIFVILVSGFVCSLLPLVAKCFRNATHPATLILRALSAGVILALAIVHVIPDGMADLAEVHDFPFGALAVVVGILIMISTESGSRAFLYTMNRQSTKKFGGAVTHTQKGLNTDGQSHLGYQSELPQYLPPAEVAHSNIAEPDKSVAAGPSAAAVHHDHHSHTCLAVNNAASWANNPNVHNQVIAYIFELACVIHSVLIGVALGATVDARSEVVALLVVLVFHQGLEGIGLGSTIVRASFSTMKAIIMISTYALTTPIGIGIGIAVANSYDPESATALAVQGTLNSISGGLLLYISLVQLIAEDFTRGDLPQLGIGLQVGMHAALAFGAGCMAMLAIWA